MVLAATERQQTRHQRRTGARQALKVAALLMVLGPALWLAWPRPEPVPRGAEAAPGHTLPTSPATPALPINHALDPEPASPAPPATVATQPGAPLEQRLISFYLPPMKFEQVTLAEALRQIEAQMKAINQNIDHDLARLLLQMPASAAQQKITFDSPGMGVLPLVQAIAGLAGCRGRALPQYSPRLVLNLSNPQIQRQTRTFSTFTSEEELANADQLARDARAVGIDTSSWQVNDKGQRLPPAQITASAGQLKALDALDRSPCRALANTADEGARPGGAASTWRKTGELTIKERDDYLARSDLTPSATFELKPGTQGVSLSPRSPRLSKPRPAHRASAGHSVARPDSVPQLAINTSSARSSPCVPCPWVTGGSRGQLPELVPPSTWAATLMMRATPDSIADSSITVPDSNLSLPGKVTTGSADTADLLITSITMNYATAPRMVLNSGNNYAGAIVSLGNGHSMVILTTP